VACPGFPTDCLETLEEINMEVRRAFVDAGGREFSYIPCLNDSSPRVRALADLAERHLAGWPTRTLPGESELLQQQQRARALGATA
jgi:ferrochelatase